MWVAIFFIICLLIKMGFPPLGTFQRNSGVTSPAQISVKTSPHRRPRGHHRSRKRSSVDGKSCCRHPLFDAGCDLFLSSKPGQFLNFHLPCLKKFQIPGQLDLVLLTEKIKRSDDCVEVHITKPNIKTSKSHFSFYIPDPAWLTASVVCTPELSGGVSVACVSSSPLGTSSVRNQQLMQTERCIWCPQWRISCTAEHAVCNA